jgi:DNA-binding Lrp family transcriptional regulator
MTQNPQPPTERGRAQPNGPSAAERGRQGTLPFEQLDTAGDAYLAAVADCRFPKGISSVLCWLLEGRREGGFAVRRKLAQRELAKRLELSASTICEAVARLRDSGLVDQADGVYRLQLSFLVEVAEQALTRRQSGDLPSAEAALDCLGARQRSAALGSARTRRSVKKENIYPVIRSVPSSPNPNGAEDQPSAAERERVQGSEVGGQEDGVLKTVRAWQRLQTEHFRPRLDVRALQAAFYAAVEAGLFESTLEHKIRFLATAFDLANSKTVRKPAPCLRSRVERLGCYRFSEEGNRWAKSVIKPPIADETRQLLPSLRGVEVPSTKD